MENLKNEKRDYHPLITSETAHLISSGFLDLNMEDSYMLCNRLLSIASHMLGQPKLMLLSQGTFTQLMRESVKVSEAIMAIGYEKVIDEMGDDLALSIDLAIAYILNCAYINQLNTSDESDDVLLLDADDIDSTADDLCESLKTIDPDTYTFGTMVPSFMEVVTCYIPTTH